MISNNFGYSVRKLNFITKLSTWKLVCIPNISPNDSFLSLLVLFLSKYTQYLLLYPLRGICNAAAHFIPVKDM